MKINSIILILSSVFEMDFCLLEREPTAQQVIDLIEKAISENRFPSKYVLSAIIQLDETDHVAFQCLLQITCKLLFHFSI